MGVLATRRLAATITAIERGADMDALRHSVRARLPTRWGMTATSSMRRRSREVVSSSELLWLEGDWADEGERVRSPKPIWPAVRSNRHVLETDHPFFWTKDGQAGSRSLSGSCVRPRWTWASMGLQVPVFGYAGLIGAMSFGGNGDRQLGRHPIGADAGRHRRLLRGSAARKSRMRPCSCRTSPIVSWR